MSTYRRGRSTGPLLLALFLCVALLVPGIAAAQGELPAQEGPPPPLIQGPEGQVMQPDDARVAPGAPETANLSPEASGDYRIDTLLSGYQWPASWATVTYSFYEDDVFHGTYYGSETVSEVSEPVKSNVRQIMAWYGTVMDLNFVEVTETTSAIGYIRFMRSNGPSYAYAYYPTGTALFSLPGDIHLNPSYDRLGDTNGFQHPPGRHGYLALVHEIGHTLGLKHPHEAPVMPEPEDNYSHTVMTYDFLGSSAGTPMPYDLMALQYIYGNRVKNAANDTYAFTASGLDQYNLNGSLFWNTSYHAQQTIWDTGGYNVLDLTNIPGATGYRLDIKGLGWLTRTADFYSAADETYMQYGMRLGNGVTIDQVINSAGSDTIYASPAANTFSGYGRTRITGADVLYDATAADTLDLSGYTAGEVAQGQNGANHVITFPGSNGSVTIVNYYGGNAPVITFDTVVPAISINDVTLTEGDSGATAATFTVSLSQPSAATITVQWATADGSAQSGSDYTGASGLVTFAPNDTSENISVQVIGDTVVEPDETFYVNLSDAAGATIADAQGIGAILNNDVLANVPPIAAATASPISGVAPLAVAFSGSGSTDPDGSIASYAWNFGDGGAATGVTVNYTYNNSGTYTAVLTVTDDRGAADTDSVVITVSPNPANVMHVHNIALEVVTSGRNKSVRAVVTVMNSNHTAAVLGATVNASFTGPIRQNVVGNTDLAGTVIFNSKSTTKKGVETFTVTNVSKSGSTYNSSQNERTSATITIP